MLNDQETSAIHAALESSDAYAWVRLMAVLAQCDVTDLDADAIFDIVRKAGASGLPDEVADLRAFDAAGALVRAQFAFSDRSARNFEERFADARQFLATRCIQAGYQAVNPAARAREVASLEGPGTGSGMGVFGAVITALVVVVLIGVGVAAMVLAGESEAVEVEFDALQDPDVFAELDEVIGDLDSILVDAGVPALSKYGLPLQVFGSSQPLQYRALIERGTKCRYAVGGPSDYAAVESGNVAGEKSRRSVIVRVMSPAAVYAEGCAFAPVPPVGSGAPPYEGDGDRVVGLDVPAGEALLTAGETPCAAGVRAYRAGGIAEILAPFDIPAGESTSVDLAPADGETLVLTVDACTVAVPGA